MDSQHPEISRFHYNVDSRVSRRNFGYVVVCDEVQGQRAARKQSWVVNGIKLEIIIDYVKRVRANHLDKPTESHLTGFFKMINESEGDWKVPESVVEADEGVGEVKEKKKHGNAAAQLASFSLSLSHRPQSQKH